jgi:hypothetical protein
MSERSLYSNLFRYRPREKRDPLEDFLTEALADLFNRLLHDRTAEMLRYRTIAFIKDILCSGRGGKAFGSMLLRAKRLEFKTQIPIEAQDDVGDVRGRGRADLCLYADGRLVLVVENKRFPVGMKNGSDVPTSERAIATQLKFYANWLRDKNAGLILLGVDQGPKDLLANTLHGSGQFARGVSYTRSFNA